MSKVLSFEELKKRVETLKKEGKKVVLCHGVFDLVHPGHILHFKAAKTHGDILIVTLTKDEYVFKGPGRPYFNQRLRLETIAALEAVDYVALNEWPTSIETLKQLKPDFYAKGSDYKKHEQDVTGNIALEVAAVKEVGGKVVYTDEEMFSSSKLINSYFQSHPEETSDYLTEFKKKFSADQIVQSLKCLKGLNVLVVGETILDQYSYCQPLAKTPKDIIVSGRFVSNEDFAGGTAAMANHLANFCKNVSLISVMGSEQEHLQYFQSKLASNVKFLPVIDEKRSTIIKRRFMATDFLKKMFELQIMDDGDLPPAIEDQIVQQIEKEAAKADLVVVGDFGHGMLTERVKESLYNCGKFLALNTQSNSANMGFNPVTAYKRADYVSIDEPELRFAAHSKYGEIEMLAEEIKGRLEADHFMVSLGAAGNAFLSKEGNKIRTPVFSTRVVDRTGAGDALFSVTAPCVYTGLHPEMVGFIANCVGALAVETVCNREAIDARKLFKFITYLLK
ncbi:MAG: PfkB family carbohydrate kinase [Deltaproteobacteria bacterium]|nr:PfkB family carbohydrate kinase [Deltaproteobacteria bacterium]